MYVGEIELVKEIPKNLINQIETHSDGSGGGRADNDFPAKFMSEHFKFKPEMELLLYNLRQQHDSKIDEQIKELLTSEINWDEFIGLAGQHAVIPLVYKTLNSFSHYIPLPILSRLKNLVQLNSFHSLYLTSELLRLLAVLKSSGIKPLPYKGPVLAEVAYGDISLRQFGDLDILISKKDILKTKELFKSINYFPKNLKTEEQDQVFIDSSRPYNYKFISENGKVIVELHWMFTSKHNSFKINYDWIMENLTTVKIADQVVSSLKVENLLVILCQHGSKHFWIRLLWICDVAALINRHPNINWEEVIDFSIKSGAKRMLFLGLNLSQILLNVQLPDNISKQIKADWNVKKLTNRVIKQFTLDKDNLIQNSEIHSFSCEMRERWLDKARYCTYNFMPRRILSLSGKLMRNNREN